MSNFPSRVIKHQVPGLAESALEVSERSSTCITIYLSKRRKVECGKIGSEWHSRRLFINAKRVSERECPDRTHAHIPFAIRLGKLRIMVFFNKSHTF